MNQLGSYHRIWQDQIPLPVQALYVLRVREEIQKNGPYQILVEGFEDAVGNLATLFTDKEELRKSLAALYYHLEPAKAMQVLLGNTIREALEGGKRSELSKLAEQVAPSVLWQVVVTELFEAVPEWVSERPDAIFRAAWAADEVGERLSEPEKSEFRDALKHLATQIDKVEKEIVLDEELADGIGILMNSLPDE